jgi:hypothetical protein
MRAACSLLSILLLAPACATTRAASATSPTAASGSGVLATLEHTHCLGSCPWYTLTVYGDGRVEWAGVVYVKVVGKQTAMLTAEELRSLRDAFAAASYLQLDDDYTCHATDMPTVVISFRDGRRTKEIHHDEYCSEDPRVEKQPQLKKLTELETTFERIVKSERWVGAMEERQSPTDIMRNLLHALEHDPDPAVQQRSYEELLKDFAGLKYEPHSTGTFNRDRDVDWNMLRQLGVHD